MKTSSKKTFSHTEIAEQVVPLHLSKHIFLTSLRQAQQHKMSADLNCGEVVRLRGPLDLVKWKELHVPHDAIRAALVHTELVPSDLLVSEPYLLNYQGMWNPVIELWGNQSQGHDFDMIKIHAAVEAVVLGLTRSGENDVEDICEVVLEKEQREAVHQVILETLNVIGGRRIAAPVLVHAGEVMLELGGKLGAKKSKINLQPVDTIFKGRFSGIKIDPCVLIFKTNGMNVDLSFAIELVDLGAVLDVMLAELELEVRTQKTITSSGREVYVYIPQQTFLKEGFQP